MSRRSARRQFFRTSAGLFGGLAFGDFVRAGDMPDGRPPVKNPRATSGDKRSEPVWDEKLTITVGPKEADMVGAGDKVIQAAVDYLAGLGGGTVRLTPGTFTLRAAVRLRSGIRLTGSGPETILTRPASVRTKLSADSDWYDQEITLADAKGFQVGDSVCLQAKNTDTGGQTVIKRVLVARAGNRFKLDKALRENVWTMGEASCATLYPLLTSEETERLVIENLALDGSGKNVENFNGNYGGCIFLQDVSDVLIRKVIARNYNGDGISWQIAHDVTVEDCHSHDNADLGLHPGSGSQRPLIRRNTIQRCQIGIFFCWGVKYGLAESNTIEGIRGQSVSIGHRDTDNIVRNNVIRDSGQTGVLFRPERGASFAGHRNLIEGNLVENSGPETGVAIDVQGGTESVVIAKNRIVETRSPASRVGIRLGTDTRDIATPENTFSGLAKEIQRLPS
jgi:hypothetical protein